MLISRAQTLKRASRKSGLESLCGPCALIDSDPTPSRDQSVRIAPFTMRMNVAMVVLVKVFIGVIRTGRDLSQLGVDGHLGT